MRRDCALNLPPPRRQERALFIAVNLIGNGLGYLLLRALNAPASLSVLLLVYVALGTTMLTISAFWKISLHAGGVGGFAAALTWLFGPARALTFLAIPLVGLDARVSPETAARVDTETRRIIEEAVGRTWNLLEADRGALDRLAERLCQQETVSGEEVAAVLAHAGSNGRPRPATVALN